MEHSRTGRTLLQGGGLDQMLEVVDSGPDAAAPQAFLLVVSGAEPGRLYPIEQPEITIGRSKSADIHIGERAISQRHAKLVRSGDHHRLHDLGSTNGTFVNDVKVDQVELEVGDVIRTGETVFTYMASGGPSAGEQTVMLRAQRGADTPPVNPGRLARRSPLTGIVAVPPLPPQPYEPPPQRISIGPGEDGPDFITQLLRIIAFFQRYWLSIFVLTAMGAGAGIASYKLFKPPAKAKFEISLVPAATDNPVEQQKRFNFQFFRSAQLNFLRPALIHQTLTELGERDVTPERIRLIQKRLEFQRTSEFSYQGSFEAGSPEEATQFLDIHLRRYLDTEIDKALKVLLTEVKTLEEQLAAAEQELQATDQALLAFKTENSDGLPEQAQQLYGDLIALGTDRGKAASEVARTAAELTLSRRRLKSETPLVESRIEMARPYESAIADVKRQLAEAKASGKGAAHPQIEALKAQLVQLEQLRDEVMEKGTVQIVQSKNPVFDRARNQVDEAETAHKIALAELGRLTNDLERTEAIVGKLPELQTEYSELMRSYDSTKRVHANLFEKLNASRIQLEMERASATARWDIITPPNVEPASRTKTVTIRAGALGMLGMLLGIVLGLFREVRRYVAGRMALMRR